MIYQVKQGQWLCDLDGYVKNSYLVFVFHKHILLQIYFDEMWTNVMVTHLLIWPQINYRNQR